MSFLQKLDTILSFLISDFSYPSLKVTFNLKSTTTGTHRTC